MTGRDDSFWDDVSDGDNVIVALDVSSCPDLDSLLPLCSVASFGPSSLSTAKRRSSAGDRTSTLCGAVIVVVLDWGR